MTLLSRANKILRHPAFLLAIRIGVGGIFLVFGVSKVIEPHEEFFSIVATYQVLPPSAVPIFGTILLLAEIIVGFAFLVGLYSRWSAYAVVGLLLMFIGAISQTMLRGIPLADCGCSGSFVSFGETPTEVLIRDGLMLIGVLWFLYARSSAWTVDQLFGYTKRQQE